MHMGIGIIVYADDVDEATRKANSVADRLCVNNDPFDYHTNYKNEVYGEFSGYDFTKANPITDARTMNLVKQRHGYTKENFINNVKKMRADMRNKTPETLWKQRDDMWRYYASCIGDYRGSSIWLYDDDGEGIRNDSHLEDVLNKWPTHTNTHESLKDKQIFALFQDVHF